MWIKLLKDYNTGLVTVPAGGVIEVDNATGKALIEAREADLTATPARSDVRGRDETRKPTKERASVSKPGEISSPD